MKIRMNCNRVTSWLSAKVLVLFTSASSISSPSCSPRVLDAAGYDNWDFQRLAGNLGYRTNAESLPSISPVPNHVTRSGPLLGSIT